VFWDGGDGLGGKFNMPPVGIFVDIIRSMRSDGPRGGAAVAITINSANFELVMFINIILKGIPFTY
jgi:hypothetical protein